MQNILQLLITVYIEYIAKNKDYYPSASPDLKPDTRVCVTHM